MDGEGFRENVRPEFDAEGEESCYKHKGVVLRWGEA